MNATSLNHPIELSVHARGDWFAVDGGPPVDLTRTGNIRKALLKLVAEHASSPGAPVHWRRLVAEIWAGETILDAAARNRLRVTIAGLRQIGLRPALLSDGRGYRLCPDVIVRVVPCDPARPSARGIYREIAMEAHGLDDQNAFATSGRSPGNNVCSRAASVKCCSAEVMCSAA